MTRLSALIAAALALLTLAGCGGDRFRLIDGPAKFQGTFPGGITLSGELEEGGRVYFGPTPPPTDARSD